jgi:hypothetical protein
MIAGPMKRVIVLAWRHVFMLMNSGILIDTFTGTTIGASPERTAVGANAHNSHRMHLLGM